MNLGITFLNALSRLPLPVLYGISDYLLYPLVSRFYRRRVVRKNLDKAFAERTPQERREIERRFYHWFCDLAMETVRVHSISPKEIQERFVWTNIDEVERSMAAEGRDFACCYLSHYCNWEMCVGLPLWLQRMGMCQIYHPLRNKAMDDWFLHNRAQFSAENIKMKETIRRLVTLRKGIQEGAYHLPNGHAIEGFLFGCIADQLPKKENIHLRVPFLQQDTGVFSGSEKLARKFGMSVWLLEVQMPSRGHYVGTLHRVEVSEEELQADEFAYTRRYLAFLEQQIQQRPELWLWTHDRWKR